MSVIPEEVRIGLERARSLPSPPPVAARLLALADDPDVSIGDVVDLVSLDPALAAKLLRLASSPLYVRNRRPETLREAAMALGLNTVFATALSFSLVPPQEPGVPALLTQQVWRRGALAAAAARVVAERLGVRAEEASLVGLLQGIGVLAVHRVRPEVYEGVPADVDHEALVEVERRRLGCDHAAVGAFLLRHWHLPLHVVDAVAASHDRSRLLDGSPDGGGVPAEPLVATSVVASVLADVFADDAANIEPARRLLAGLGIEDELTPVLAELTAVAPTLAGLHDVDSYDMVGMLEEAREVLLQRQALLDGERDRLAERTRTLEARTEELEARSDRDDLTGVANRGALERWLADHWATRPGPVAVLFADLDHFKAVNDLHGHLVGDRVLVEVARRLEAVAPPGAIVARFGGEEFVVVVPDPPEPVGAVADAFVRAVRDRPVPVEGRDPLAVTISVGLAVADPATESRDGVIGRADDALYAAKGEGRDTYVVSPLLRTLGARAR